jgi:hypothetical protein
VRGILESHFISPAALAILLRDPFEVEDFEAFIAERQRTIQDAIENLLIKDRLNLPPQLREIDALIERVELSLRQVVKSALESDASLLPSHLLPKVEERISSAIKKNPALEAESFQFLDRKLEFFDLREIEQVIVSIALWPRFEPRFASKEALSMKFNQLAELRNGIRHSRTVDEITRMEGEASLLWFNQVLLA